MEKGVVFGNVSQQFFFPVSGLSTEGNLRFRIDWASLITGNKSTIFALFYYIFEGNFPSTSPRGLIFGGAI